MAHRRPLPPLDDRTLTAIMEARPDQLLNLVFKALGLTVPRGPTAKQRALEAAARAAAEARARREAAQASADYELRTEVIAAMTAKGIARHVAANRTNTEAKLVAEAKALGIL